MRRGCRWVYPTDAAAVVSIGVGTIVFFSHLSEAEVTDAQQVRVLGYCQHTSYTDTLHTPNAQVTALRCNLSAADEHVLSSIVRLQ